MKNICCEVKKQGRFTHLDGKTKLYVYIMYNINVCGCFY